MDFGLQYESDDHTLSGASAADKNCELEHQIAMVPKERELRRRTLGGERIRDRRNADPVTALQSALFRKNLPTNAASFVWQSLLLSRT